MYNDQNGRFNKTKRRFWPVLGKTGQKRQMATSAFIYSLYITHCSLLIVHCFVSSEVPETAAHDPAEAFGESGPAPAFQFPDLVGQQQPQAFAELLFEQDYIKADF